MLRESFAQIYLYMNIASGVALAQSTLYEQARMAERAGHAKAAVELYVQAARNGDGKAAYRLGEIYGKGLGDVRADRQESLKWFNAARVLGYPPFIGDFPSPGRR